MDEIEVRVGGRGFGKSAELQRRVEAFTDSMRSEGIHVGVGAPGDAHCVTCGQLWPCDESKEATK